MDISDTETSMLQRQDTVDDCADYRGRPVHRANSGGWKSALFIIGVEMAERLAFCGTGSNLITYLTGPLGQSTATAAQNANKWSGTSQLLPLLGAFVADSFLGRYRTIFLLLLFMSCEPQQRTNSIKIKTLEGEKKLLSALCAVLAQGGQRPCVQAVGADQFDEKHPEECKLKSPFFNWWYFGMCTSSIFTHFIISSVQENLYWGLGFGIPCISMAIAPIVFLLGTKSYRYTMKGNGMNPFLRIGKVFVAAIRNFRAAAPSAMALEQEAGTIYSDQFKFLNKALAVPPDGSEAYAKAPSISEVEEAKALLRLVPIWTTITAVLTVPIYDRVFVPIARDLTEKAAGITMLQRFGIGLFFSVIEMVTAALVEMKRLKTAQEYGLVDKPGVIIPMDVWWLFPQYVLFGVSESFAVVCLQEHFYDQVPTELRSVRLSLYLSIFGVAVLAAL
ncbi:protein NRT1/ PTR FAMILY 5.10 [Citrus sinensis]|uniref:Protein NRT1/ PTR FAMILY 5.10 n=1 Tax=Citrus sinensis TaxID=2711 RepID=A0ACB8KUU5_CITSI|nr:protein NRT1/ PTR FAMILY 5.10 [Citrus sinensis]